MILIGVGTGADKPVTDSVKMISSVSNSISGELHHEIRLNPNDIHKFIQEKEDNRIVFACHGSDSALLDIPRKSFFSFNDLEIIKDCYVFAHACSTGASLGRYAVEHALLYIGFDIPVEAPSDQSSPIYSSLRSIYVALLGFLGAFEYDDSQQARNESENLLDSVFQIAENCLISYEDSEGATSLAMDEYTTMLQFKNDICIWVSDCPEKLKAKGAPPGPLY